MRAAHSLEKNQNIEKIFDRVELFKRQKIAFASKPVNRRGIQVDQYPDNGFTKPYEGNNEFTSNMTGKATFKVKKSSAPTPKGVSGSEGVAMFTNQEIQKICEDHMLNRGDVYKIRTAFGSMCQMSETWLAS